MAPVAALGGGADDAVEADDIRGQPRHGHGTQEMQGLEYPEQNEQSGHQMIFWIGYDWILKMNLKLMN